MKPRTVTCSPLMVNKDSAFLSKLKIDSDEILQNLPGRTLCPSCKKSRMYYCYKCMVPVAEISDKIPRVKLPFKIDIIKHEKESEGKSTACHAAILAPDDVTIYIYPNIPNYQNKKVILVFPGENANTLTDGLRNVQKLEREKSSTQMDAEEFQPSHLVDTFVFIDSTWKQTKRLYGDQRLRELPCIILSSRKSLFWRYQTGCPLTHLATIEAIYYLLRDYHELVDENRDGRYDNILFFFKFMYNKICGRYRANVDEQTSLE